MPRVVASNHTAIAEGIEGKLDTVVLLGHDAACSHGQVNIWALYYDLILPVAIYDVLVEKHGVWKAAIVWRTCWSGMLIVVGATKSATSSAVPSSLRDRGLFLGIQSLKWSLARSFGNLEWDEFCYFTVADRIKMLWRGGKYRPSQRRGKYGVCFANPARENTHWPLKRVPRKRLDLKYFANRL